MITTIKDNLGDRAGGKIGSRSVDTVVLEALNLAVPHCVQEAQPDYYNRTATINLIADTYDDGNPPTQLTFKQRVYPLPTVDDQGSQIRIKDIYSHRVYRADGSDVVMKHLSYLEFVKLTSNYSLDYVGTPAYYALWGQNNDMTLDYFPSEPYTMKLFVESYPKLITTSSLGSALPIDDQWNIVVEAYATKHCYMKLQQTEMAIIWNDMYNREKASITRMENDKQGHNIQVSDNLISVSEPALNPLVGRWN
jgi:hypothetical protein